MQHSTIPVTPNHPLSPLTIDEMTAAITLVRDSALYNADSIVDRVERISPPKQYVLSWQPNQALQRKAGVAIYNPPDNKYYQFVVNLTDLTFTVSTIPDAKPAWTYIENAKAVSLMIENGSYKTALQKRGIQEFQIDNGQVQPFLLSDGRLDGNKANKDMPPLPKGVHAFYASTFLLDEPFSAETPLANLFVYPVPGVWGFMDLAGTPKVLKITDTDEKTPMPAVPGLMKFNEAPCYYYDDYRHTLKPILISMPQGPSFTINGNWITWQRWKFFYSMDQTVGLKLNLIQYNDKKNETDPDNWRPIIYEMYAQEALTVYGSEEFGVRNYAFLDFGEYQARLFMTPLLPGVDVPPYATMLNPVFAMDDGEFYEWENGLAIYEEDAGMLWRHYEYNTGTVQGRRARNLVMTYATSIGNYDYLFHYKFGLDGIITCSVQPAGMDEMNGGIASTETSQLIFPGIVASNHQHFFSFKINWMLDGIHCNIHERETKALSSDADNEWTFVENQLKTTKKSARDTNSRASRAWCVSAASHHITTENVIIEDVAVKNVIVENTTAESAPDGSTNITHSTNHPSYCIKVQNSVNRMNGPKARISKRCLEMIENTIYVTRHRDDQPYFMGKYPVEKGECEGVVDQGNESIVDTDIDTWVSLSLSHPPKTEDFPVLNSTTLSMQLVPENFYGRNPSLDVDIDTYVSPNNVTKKRLATDNPKKRHCVKLHNLPEQPITSSERCSIN